MDFHPHCTETEVRADGNRGAYPIDTLFAFPSGQIRDHGWPEEEGHDRKNGRRRGGPREMYSVVHLPEYSLVRCLICKVIFGQLSTW